MWQCALGHFCLNFAGPTGLAERSWGVSEGRPCQMKMPAGSDMWSRQWWMINICKWSLCWSWWSVQPASPASPAPIISNLFVAGVHFITRRKVRSCCRVFQLGNYQFLHKIPGYQRYVRCEGNIGTWSEIFYLIFQNEKWTNSLKALDWSWQDESLLSPAEFGQQQKYFSKIL